MVDRDLRGDRRTGAREIGAAWSSESAGDRRIDWTVSSPLARVRSLSLSLSFSGNALKWKWGEKIISGSKVKILVNRKSFSEKYHFPWQPNMRKRVKMISWNHFHPKQTHPIYLKFVFLWLICLVNKSFSRKVQQFHHFQFQEKFCQAKFTFCIFSSFSLCLSQTVTYYNVGSDNGTFHGMKIMVDFQFSKDFNLSQTMLDVGSF